MRTVQDITFGIAGQSLTFDAPEGRPSSVESVEVFAWDVGDDDDAEEATSGDPAVEDDPNTTTDAAAGNSEDDARIVPLTDTTGAAEERRYLLIGDDGLREWVDVLEVDAGVSVTSLHPLHNDYASGSALVSTRMSVLLDDDWVADEQNLDESAGPNPSYRVRWVYVVDGVTKVADEYFNLVRYPAQHGVRPQDVELVRAGWLDSLPTAHKPDQGRRIIDGAYRAVKLDLHAALIDDTAVAESEVVDELVCYKAVERTEWARYLDSPELGPERHKSAVDAYTARKDALLVITSKTPVRDSAGAAAQGIPLPLTRR